VFLPGGSLEARREKREGRVLDRRTTRKREMWPLSPRINVESKEEKRRVRSSRLGKKQKRESPLLLLTWGGKKECNGFRKGKKERSILNLHLYHPQKRKGKGKRTDAIAKEKENNHRQTPSYMSVLQLKERVGKKKKDWLLDLEKRRRALINSQHSNSWKGRSK